MIAFIVAVLGMIIGVIVAIVEEKNIIEEIIAYGFVGLLIGLLILLGLVGIVQTSELPTVDTLTSTEPIVSLTDTYNIDSECYVFRTNIDEKLQYTYMYEDKQGYSTKTVDASKVYIRYTADTPTIKTYYSECENPIIQFLIGGAIDEYTVIYVPKGTIQENFNIDFK